MTKRQTPPGFTSILWVVVVKPFGPHHCPMCSCSVHTFHTSSRGASKTRVPRISRSPTSAAFLLSAAMLRLLGDQGSEALEGLAPALVLAAAGLARGRGLQHGQLRLAALVGERHGGNELVAGEVVQDRGEDDALVPDDLAVHAVERVVLAVGSAHDEAVGAPRAEVHLAAGQRKALRAPPFADVLPLCPQLPHELARRVEDARENYLARVPAFDEILQRSAYDFGPALLEILPCERGELREGLQALVRQPDPRLVPLGGQLEGHERVPRVALVPPRVREPLVRNRFRDLAAVGIPEAFVFDVELELDTDYRSECTEVEIPLLDVLLVGEGLPHQRHRGVESALDDKRLVLRRQIAFCGHLSSPCVNVLHLVLALQLLQIAFQPVEALFPMAPAQTFF